MPEKEGWIYHHPVFETGNKRIQPDLDRLAGYYEEAMEHGDDLSAMELVDEARQVRWNASPFRVLPGGKHPSD